MSSAKIKFKVIWFHQRKCILANVVWQNPQCVFFRPCVYTSKLGDINWHCRTCLSLIQVQRQAINTLRPRKNCYHFPDIFKHIFLNENIGIVTKISLKFVPHGPINNNPALVQIMNLRQLGDKPLSEAMMAFWRTYASLGFNELNKPVFSYHQIDPSNKLQSDFNVPIFFDEKCIWKCRLPNVSHFGRGSLCEINAGTVDNSAGNNTF